MSTPIAKTDKAIHGVQHSVLESLFEAAHLPDVEGRYCPDSQTWSHREWLQFTPVKHNQEM